METPVSSTIQAEKTENPEMDDLDEFTRRLSQRGSFSTQQIGIIVGKEENSVAWNGQHSKRKEQPALNLCQLIWSQVCFVGDWTMKVSLSYGTLMLLGCVFVFATNIGIETVLFLFDHAVVRGLWFGAFIVFLPLFMVVLIFCWKLVTQIWKILCLIWHFNKLDERSVTWLMNAMTYGSLLRIVLFSVTVVLGLRDVIQSSLHAKAIMYVNDTQLFHSLTQSTIVVMGIATVLYLLVVLAWKHWMIYECMASTNIAVDFFLLSKSFKLPHLMHACKQQSAKQLTQSVCNDMARSYGRHSIVAKMQKLQQKQMNDVFDAFSRNVGSLSDDGNDSFDESVSVTSNLRRTKKKRSRAWFACRFALLCWYVLGIVYVNVQYHALNRLLVLSSIALPLLLYYATLLNQCKIKVFDFLTDFQTHNSTFRSPIVLKALLGLWSLIGVTFCLSLFLFRSIDIRGKRDLMNNVESNAINPIWNFFEHQNQTYMQRFSYPFCQRRDEMYELLEVAMLSKIVYLREKPLVLKALRALPLFDNLTYNYKLVHASLGDSPGFIHVAKVDTGTNRTLQDIIVNRGTSENRDYFEDFTLTSEVAAITGFSKLIPITELWPASMIQQLIYYMSVTEGAILPMSKERYFKKVEKYINNWQNETNALTTNYRRGQSQHAPLIIAGHSLGGITAHVVGAHLMDQYDSQLNIRTVGISNPGLVWLSKKLNIKTHLLQQIATTIQPYLDPIPNFDKHTGTVHHIDCQSSYQEECHWVDTTFCEMFTTCTPYREYQNMAPTKKTLLKEFCTQRHRSFKDILIDLHEEL